MKKKLKRFLPLTLAACLSSGVLAYGADFDFTIYRGGYDYSDTIAKSTTKTYARVQRQTPASPETTVRFTVVNSANYVKSATKAATGVTTVDLSYSGYGVVKGDYVKLRGYYRAADNSEGYIQAGGTWTP